jgi:hypothetical protein
MASKSVIQSAVPTPSSERPRVTSYDSAYEHSLQHWLELKLLVEAADRDTTIFSAAKAS